MGLGKARKSFGSKLKRNGVYVAKLFNIDPPAYTRADVPATNHDSPDETEETIPGMKSGGEMPIQGHLIPGNASQEGLLAAFDTDDIDDWVIEFPTNPIMTMAFEGYVKEFKPNGLPVDGVIGFSATIKVTSKPVLDYDISGNLSGLAGIEQEGEAALVLTPAFAAGTYNYVTSVNTASTWVQFTVTGSDTLTVNGTQVMTGVPAQFALGAAGTVTKFEIARKEAGKAPRNYTVHVARA